MTTGTPAPIHCSIWLIDWNRETNDSVVQRAKLIFDPRLAGASRPS